MVYNEAVAENRFVWFGSSFDGLRSSPARAKRLAGYQLRRIHAGLMPSDWKPMKAIGPGVPELRIHTDLEHRVICVARFAEALYVLRSFEMRSKGTSRGDIDLARRHLVEVETRRLRQREER